MAQDQNPLGHNIFLGNGFKPCQVGLDPRECLFSLLIVTLSLKWVNISILTLFQKLSILYFLFWLFTLQNQLNFKVFFLHYKISLYDLMADGLDGWLVAQWTIWPTFISLQSRDDAQLWVGRSSAGRGRPWMQSPKLCCRSLKSHVNAFWKVILYYPITAWNIKQIIIVFRNIVTLRW